MAELTLNGIVLAPIIVALVEVLKRYLYLDSRYAPVATAILSILAYVAIQFATTDPQFADGFEYILNALIIALSSSGLYSVGKTYLK